jgi:hypothetical protein
VLVEEAAYLTAAREKARQPPPSPDPELQDLVKLFHAARITNDEQGLSRLGNLLIQAAQRLERSRLLPCLPNLRS